MASEDSLSGGVVSSRVPAESNVVANELLVTLGPDARTEVLRRIHAEPELSLVGSLMHLPDVLVRAQPGDRERMVAWLRGVRGVESVGSDAIERPVGIDCPLPGVCPDDPGFAYQWYLYNAPGIVQPPGAGTPTYGDDVDAPQAWSHTLGSAAVRIAVVDSGIDAGHPDLAGKVVAAANFTGSNTTQDLSGHGTHVAGTAAASFDNAMGIAGMAPNARLMDIKVLAVDQTGQTTGDCADVADGVVWATDHGANVINMSLGSPSSCLALQQAVDYASSHGALVVAAAGNAGSTSRFYPAAFPGVLSVAATTNDDQLAGFSNRGAGWVDVAAPGDGIISTLPTFDNGSGAVDYGYMSGTSMAAPIVSGIAALIWGLMPPATARQDVEARIFATSQPITGTGVDFRYGRVDACLAVTGSAAACVPPATSAPSPAPPAPSPAPPAPPPPQTAQPAPITTSPKAPPPLNAVPGTYKGGLEKQGKTLHLRVGDGGDALISVNATVKLKCSAKKTRSFSIDLLSTTRYGKIKSNGDFGVRTSKVKTKLLKPKVGLDGRFEVAKKRSSGTLRVTGRVNGAGNCDSGKIHWTANRR